MKVAAILHNRLLQYNGYLEFDWETCDPDADEPIEPVSIIVGNSTDIQNEVVTEVTVPTILTLTQQAMGSQDNPINFNGGNLTMLKKALIKHLHYAYVSGKLQWPRRFNPSQRERMPLLMRAVHRTEIQTRLHFRIAPSMLRRQNEITRTFTETIGNGLFALKHFRVGEHLLNFVGTIINREEYEQRTLAGRGGYILSNLSASVFLDCYDTARNGSCMASYTNSPLGCVFVGNNTRAVVANARLVINAVGSGVYIWSLKAIRTIKSGDEVLYHYSGSYVFPAHYVATIV
jgi:hypothetical protein